MVPNYISEVTNNGLTISNYLMRNRCIDIVCVYCQKFYRYFTYKALKITPQNSIVCNECNMDSMIPITPSSCLYDMNPDERTNQINIWHDEWFEPIDCEPEYEDYEYGFEKHGLGIIDGGNQFNLCSNYFHQHLRLNCSSYGFRAPLEVWQNGNAKDIWKCLGPIWRGINSERVLKEATYLSAFRLGTYIATQFKPVVAKTIYDITKADTVLDTSCGWGDRLAGFFASQATHYYGCDPNPNTYKQYMKQIEEYTKIFPNKKVKIYNCGAEDLPYNELPDIDCAFTSPPYFSTEEYNKGGEKEENQSWFKFNEYEKWRDEFYLPVADKTLAKSKFMLVNIMDPKVKNVRHRSSDELINRNRDKFIGQIGMVIMQRPQGNAKFKTKEELNEFMAMKYIENVWCFGPKDYDFFSASRKGTLENFL